MLRTTNPPGELVYTEQVLTANQDNGAQCVLPGRCCPGTGEAAVNKRRIDRLINKPSSDNSTSLYGQQEDTDWTISLRSPRSLLPASCVEIKSRCFREHGGFVLKKEEEEETKNLHCVPYTHLFLLWCCCKDVTSVAL